VASAGAGLPSKGRAEEASKLLEEVRLSEAGNVRAGAYSGGMKRRLSVAIALLGDPKVCLCFKCGPIGVVGRGLDLSVCAGLSSVARQGVFF
jgi:ABC-type taurine transport system ATPase subunit